MSDIKSNESAIEVDPLDRYSAFIIRGAIIGTGILGLALYLRNSKLFARFEHVRQIPKEFIAKEFDLKGVVREVTPTGFLKIEHIPVMKVPRLLSFVKKQSKNPGLLNVRLAGLDISEAGLSYLTKDLRLPSRRVVFNVIKDTDGNSDSVDCDVTVKKNALSSINLNIDLVRRGYARVYPPDHPLHLQAIQANASYSRLITRLMTSEKIAERRGLGVWERASWVESLQALPAQTGQIIRTSPITKFAVLLFAVTRDITLVTIEVAKQLYYLGITLGQYTATGYRHFATGVDRASKFYSNQRSRITKKSES
uniref:Uncharacterized protein n=1 Tax=Acrobeloides nanus TaxID=290746 RepID=A0A914CU85_9BILA